MKSGDLRWELLNSACYTSNMSTLSVNAQLETGQAIKLRRTSVAEYHKLIQDGYIGEEERIELIDGLILEKMPKNPPHVVVVTQLVEQLMAQLPPDVSLRSEQPITLEHSEPEPDIVIAKGKTRTYFNHHPAARDILYVIEVANSSVDIDLGVKLKQYAIEGIENYVVINIAERRAECFSSPKKSGEYANQRRVGESQVLSLDVNGSTLKLNIGELFQS